jgi:hypothetical protein
MFRVKTTRRNVKRAVSPIRPATDISGHVDLSALTQATNEVIQVQAQAPTATPVDQSMEKQFNSFFEDESAATSLTRPWLRLERGFRLKKYRAFAEAYPGLSDLEKENLYKVLVKANDAKLLNTKTQIQYEGGVIQSIKGLKIIKTGDPTQPAVFKIDAGRATKKNTE